MNEGWYADDYLILFSEDEIAEANERYEASDFLPGYRILGLIGWDDFIVDDPAGKVYRVPSVPFDANYLSPYLPPLVDSLVVDERFRGKVKWYTKPVVFGGDPNSSANLIWVDHTAHTQLVNWWNRQYRAVRRKAPVRE